MYHALLLVLLCLLQHLLIKRFETIFSGEFLRFMLLMLIMSYAELFENAVQEAIYIQFVSAVL